MPWYTETGVVQNLAPLNWPSRSASHELVRTVGAWAFVTSDTFDRGVDSAATTVDAAAASSSFLEDDIVGAASCEHCAGIESGGDIVFPEAYAFDDS